MKADDRLKCVPVMMAIERAGGPGPVGEADDNDSAELIASAVNLKLVAKHSIGHRYTLKANKLRREVLLELADGVGIPSTEYDGKIMDARIGEHTFRARVAGQFTKEILRLRHWNGERWQTIGVHHGDCWEVHPSTL